MPLSNLVVHAALQAFADAMGISAAAHALALGLWIQPPEGRAFGGFVALGAGAAVVLATRARLFPMLSEAVRSLGRPRSFHASMRAREALISAWICIISALFGLLLQKAGAEALPAPRTVAVGLGATALAVFAGTYVSSLRAGGTGARSPSRNGGAPRTGFESPSFVGGTLAGAAHAFGSWPGVSRVGIAAAVLFSLGVKPVRALEITLIATVPFWGVDAVRALSEASEFGKGNALLAALFGFLGALGAVSLLRRLAARRALAALSLWMLPLACAIFAYGRAHHAPPSLHATSFDLRP